MTTAQIEFCTFADKLEKASGLSQMDARTALYWATGTYGLSELGRYPILAIRGATGTGKTTILNKLNQITNGAPNELINGKKITWVGMRTKMAEHFTVCIDECEANHEELLLSRYSTESSTIDVNVGNRSGWNMTPFDVFGATAVHQRVPFRDSSVESRTIVLRTVQKSDIEPLSKVDVDEMQRAVNSMAREVRWSQAKFDLGRVSDTWAPLLLVGETFADGEWLSYANGRIAEATETLAAARSFEPAQIAYLAVLRHALEQGGGVQDRVELQAARESLLQQGGDFSSWQLGSLLRGAGMTVATKGGKTWVYTGGEAKLRSIGQELNVEDSWLDE